MSNEIPSDIQASAGPLLLGYALNWGLYGALSVQVYTYYVAFPNDRLVVKTLVLGVYGLETVQTILVTHDLFHAFALGWGNLEQLLSAQLEWLATPILSGIVSCIVQMFFAYRISILSESRTIGLLVSMIAITQCASAMASGIRAGIIGNFAKSHAESFVSTSLWLAGSAACDVIIATTMSYYLSKRNSVFKSTQILINRLIRLTIETGTLTAAVATIDVVLFLSFPHNNYHTTPALTLAKLYSNSLLLTFNDRMPVVDGRNSPQSTETLEFRTIAFNTSIPGNNTNLDNAPTTSVGPAQSIGMHQDT